MATRFSLDARTSLASGSADRGDRVFEGAVSALAAAVPLVLAGIVVLLLVDALPALQRSGLGFLTDSTWNPVTEQFGAAAYVYGTVVTSLIALMVATPIGVGCALFLAEYAPLWLRGPVSFVIELLAAIPSIIYGLWGFFILAPTMRSLIEPFLKNTLGPVPLLGALFSGPIIGRDLLMASAIANQFTEADKASYFSAIVAVALVLLLVAASMNGLARLLVWTVARGPGGTAVRAGRDKNA